MLEQADRARRSAEQELQDCNESLGDMNAQNMSLLTSKRRAEAEMDTLKQELEDVTSEARMIEDKAHRYTYIIWLSSAVNSKVNLFFHEYY